MPLLKAPAVPQVLNQAPENELASGRSGSLGPEKKARRGPSLSLKGRALRLLTGREHSRLELERKLAAHEQTPGELARVLDELQAKDFINEDRVVESVLHRRASRLGAARIKHELQGKGLSPEVMAQALGQLKSSEVERAQAVWAKKFGNRPPADAAERAKQMRFLTARGFGSEAVRRAVSNSAAIDHEDLN